MPRDKFAIHTFDKGIMSSADQSDIVEGAAAWSIDENPESIPGTIQPRMTDTVFKDTADTYAIEKYSWIARSDGKRDLVFYNAKDFHVDSITDFHGAPSTYNSTVGELTSTRTVSMNTVNHAVRMGWGDNKSKYIGYVDHGQFAGAIPSTIQYINAECAVPSEIPLLYNTFYDGTNIYGIEWQGKYIYKITPATGVWTRSKSFTSLQGICNGPTGFIYVFDKVGDYGIVCKITKTTLGVNLQADIGGFGSDATTVVSYLAGLVISDIAITGTYMFFATYLATTVANTDDAPILFRIALASITADAVIVPTIFWTSNIFQGTGDGEAVNIGGSISTIKKSLFIPSETSDEIALVVDINFRIIYDTGNRDTQPRWSIIYFKHGISYPYLAGTYSHPLKVAAETNFVELDDPASTTVIGNVAPSYDGDAIYSLAFHNPTDNKIEWINVTTTGRNFITSAWTGIQWNKLTDAHELTIAAFGNGISLGVVSMVYYGVMTSGVGGIFTSTYDAGWSAITYIRSPFGLTATQNTVVDGSFSTTKRYFYKASYVYHQYQESPLSNTPYTIAGDDIGANNSVDITGQLFSTSTTLSIGVSAVKIYRAEASTLTATVPETLYRLVGTVEIELGLGSGTITGWGVYKKLSLNDTGIYGPSYEAETGISETLPNNTMDYTISTIGAGFHFIAQAYNDELEGLSNIVFRSKQNAPDMFDWSNDFCVLPNKPIALHYFKGILYAFTESVIYAIDPINFVLVGEYPGFGVQSDRAICSNENAMFFANADNVYMHDGKTPQIISYPINQIGTTISGATSHRTLSTSRTVHLAITPKYNSLIVSYTGYTQTSGLLIVGRSYILGTVVAGDNFTNVGAANNNENTLFVATGVTPTTWSNGSTLIDAYTSMFVFHLGKQAWYYWDSTNVAGGSDYTTADKRSILVDYLGVPYLSVYKGILKLCGSTTGKTCTWYSKEINFGDDVVNKKVYFIDLDGTVTASPHIGYNGTTPVTDYTSDVQLATSPTPVRAMQLGFTLASGQILKGITIIFRRLLGLR
jgi:hypothetical protein